ncbi:MAG: 2,3-diketo-5-methylthio-1-phosphopentane phosphatase [Gammaproteobacteria bacterium RBG_16_57_12]|nr:MAG: 2,3-diketo-5-methylthio-1-phosphopentane phosphatase [Gammaproteobacteria bacterium RBG_16_57_12]
MIQAIVTDIEGTTTSLSFVKDVLFPYSRAHMAEFIRREQDKPEVREQLLAVSQEAGETLSADQAIARLIRWIDEDRKVTPLKALQGMLWEAGYRNGAYTGHVYSDAVRNLRAWREKGLRLYVFSSGSVQAQKLLFGYSDAGDLTSLFSGYFDTTIGAKRQATAYHTIARTIGLAPRAILFLSDIREELDAAREAGMQTIWLVRDQALDTRASHNQVGSFDDIHLP